MTDSQARWQLVDELSRELIEVFRWLTFPIAAFGRINEPKQ